MLSQKQIMDSYKDVSLTDVLKLFRVCAESLGALKEKLKHATEEDAKSTLHTRIDQREKMLTALSKMIVEKNN